MQDPTILGLLLILLAALAVRARTAAPATFIVAVAMMIDAVCSLASWRRLSDQLERVRADLADRINESLADASDSMLERIPESRFTESGDLPEWLIDEYLTPLESAVPKIENWVTDLSRRGQAGPMGLPVIQ